MFLIGPNRRKRSDRIKQPIRTSSPPHDLARIRAELQDDPIEKRYQPPTTNDRTIHIRRTPSLELAACQSLVLTMASA